MKTISKTFGKTFKFQIGDKEWEVTKWKIVDKGLALYRQGTYVGTVLRKSEDYNQLKQDLMQNSIRRSV